MNTFEFIKKSIVDLKYARFYTVFATVFALAYHLSFLFVFYFLGVMPMFYFNIFSVLLFCTLFISVIKNRDFIFRFIFFYIEVVLHQIFADYYLGGNSSFHFFILLTGILPLLTFQKRVGLASIYGLISVLLFTVFEIFSTDILPKYEVSYLAHVIIKSINVLMTSFVNIGALLIYSYVLWHKEYSLEAQVRQKEIESAVQNRRIMLMQNNIISSLASLVENRDTDTGEHIQRTSEYVDLLTNEAYKRGIYPGVITSDFVALARRAAPLHDVGKIMVSDSVLKKPGRLTPEEFEQIKLHTTEGGRIISEVVGLSEDKDFIRIASEVASNHHERWDGSGYPYKLKGEEIPVSARIMAIADVFDALVSPRCYKKELSQEDALEIIREGAGTHFDPVLVDVFLSIEEDVKKVLLRFSR